METKPSLSSRLWRFCFGVSLLLFLLLFLYALSILISTLNSGVVV